MKLSFRAEEKQELTKFFGKTWVTWILSTFMVLFTAGTLAFLVYRQREVLLSYSWNLNWSLLALSLFVHLVMLLLGAYVWAQIIELVGPRLPFSQHFRAFCLNMMARRIPGAFWYVVYRAQSYQRHGFSIKATSLASGIELAVSIISGGITTLFFTVFIGINYNPWFFFALLLITLLALNPRTLKWVFRKLSVQQVEIPTTRLLKWVLLYVLLWLMGGIVVSLLVNVFYALPNNQIGYVIGYWALVGTVSQLLVFLPSNFGFSEVSLSLLLSQHMPSSIAVLIAVSARIIFIAFELIWSFITLVLVKDRC